MAASGTKHGSAVSLSRVYATSMCLVRRFMRNQACCGIPFFVRKNGDGYRSHWPKIAEKVVVILGLIWIGMLARPLAMYL